MPAFARCPRCQATVSLPDRPVSKTCCPRCKTIFPVRHAPSGPNEESTPQPDYRPVGRNPTKPAVNPPHPSRPAERVRITCPGCRSNIHMPLSMMGKRISCPKCHHAFEAVREAVKEESPIAFRKDQVSSQTEMPSARPVDPPPRHSQMDEPRPTAPTEYAELDDREEISVSNKRYSENTLVPGEQVVYYGELHWMIFVPGVILIPLCGVGLLVLLMAWLRKITNEFTVTNKRVLMKTGIISRRTLEMNLAKIENIQVDQGIFGRLFDYGTVTVVGTGGTKEPFRYLARPLEMRRAVQNQSYK